MYLTGNIATPSLILCKTNTDQTFHLDIIYKSSKQYGMVLTNGASTTVVCQPTVRTGITNLSSLTKLLAEGIQHTAGFEFLMPSPGLIKVINSISDETTIAKNIAKGYGELFRICRKDQCIDRDNFNWRSSRIVEAPIGTFYSMDGGIIHAGAGAENGDIMLEHISICPI